MEKCSFHRITFSRGDECSLTGEWVPIPSKFYYDFCRYNGSGCPRLQEHGKYVSSGCFITTVIHNILGDPDDCRVLNDFRQFRDGILQKNPKYYEGLKEYDGIGPTVACCLVHDKDAKDMAEMTYEIDLLKVHKLYLLGKYDEAYEYYCKMTRDLISYYGLDDMYNQMKLNDFGYADFEPEKAGHGRGRVLVRKSEVM